MIVVRLLEDYNVATEDRAALDVLRYQIAKSLDQALVEGVPEIVASIDEATETDPGSVPAGHKFMTEDETLYRLPSGAYVEVTWGLVSVPREEAEAQLAEIRTEEEEAE